ncbi:MAG: hypothetical protein AAGM38_11880 [Pseudomonadota bacterium]
MIHSNKARPETPWSIFTSSMGEAAMWSLIGVAIFNTFGILFPIEGWPYGLSVAGVVAGLAEGLGVGGQVVLYLLCFIVAMATFLMLFMPLIQSCRETPLVTALTFVLVVASTIGLFQAIWFMATASLLLNWHLFANSVIPIFIFTIFIAGRSGKIRRAVTGTRETYEVGGEAAADGANT